MENDAVIASIALVEVCKPIAGADMELDIADMMFAWSESGA
jgi:hypothetical protein